MAKQANQTPISEIKRAFAAYGIHSLGSARSHRDATQTITLLCEHLAQQKRRTASRTGSSLPQKIEDHKFPELGQTA